MIEKVTLLNFISHADTTLPLQEGITVFVGRNGAGKSSVIDGITYALYGKHKRKSNENLVRRGAHSGSASIEFSSAGRTFVVERKLNKRGQLEGSVLKEIRNGSARQLASGERRQFGESLSDEVTKVIGLDYERMRVAAIIQQGELDSIVNLTPKETKELVNGLIGIDRLGVAHDSMLQLIASFRATQKTKHGYDDTDIGSLRERIAEQGALALSGRESLTSLAAELQELREDEAALEQELKEMEPLKIKVEVLRKETDNFVDYLNQRRREIEQKYQKLADVLEKGAIYLKVAKEEAQVLEEGETLKAEQSDNDASLQGLSAQIAALDVLQERPGRLLALVQRARASVELVDREETIRQSYKDTEAAIESVDSSMRRILEEKGWYEGQVEIAEKLEFKDNICPMCGTRVEKVHEIFDRHAIGRHLAEQKESLARLTGEKQRLEPEFKRAQKEMRALEDARAFMVENHIAGADGIETLELERRSLVEKLSNLPGARASLAKALSKKRDIMSRIEFHGRRVNEITRGKGYLTDHGIATEDDLDQMRLEADELQGTMRALPRDLAALKGGVESISTLRALAFDELSRQMLRRIADLGEETSRFDRREYSAKSERLQNLLSRVLPSKMGDVERCRVQMESAEKEEKALGDALVGAEETAEYVKLLEAIRSTVFHRDGPVSGSLRSWALEQIGTKASEYARLFGIGVSRIALRERARDITIECYGLKGMVEVDSLSGGEKVAIALALRFAMAYVMGGYKLDFVILDEPTVHLDEERKASMVEIISSLGKAATSPLKQIIIITHDAEIFENAEVEAIYRFEASPEGTRVTREIER